MSIKPVDFQIMIPRTVEVAKSSNDVTQKNYMLQQQNAASTQQDADNTLKQVYSQKRAQDARIAQRQGDKQNNGKHQKKKEKNGGSEGETQKKALQTSTIDIKI